jgi:hypothetical protein
MDVISLNVTLGAHHYDLRGAHEGDTKYVKAVRKEVKDWIYTWIKAFAPSR